MSNISRNHLADAPLMRRVPEEANMGRAALLWLIGIPIPIILLVWLLGGLHKGRPTTRTAGRHPPFRRPRRTAEAPVSQPGLFIDTHGLRVSGVSGRIF